MLVQQICLLSVNVSQLIDSSRKLTEMSHQDFCVLLDSDGSYNPEQPTGSWRSKPLVKRIAALMHT